MAASGVVEVLDRVRQSGRAFDIPELTVDNVQKDQQKVEGIINTVHTMLDHMAVF
jgi:hypothetical protein